jgi:hypothetical protein
MIAYRPTAWGSGDAMSEYRVYVIGYDGHFIKLECADDKAAIESAKQFIDGHDIELWQANAL